MESSVYSHLKWFQNSWKCSDVSEWTGCKSVVSILSRFSHLTNVFVLGCCFVSLIKRLPYGFIRRQWYNSLLHNDVKLLSLTVCCFLMLGTCCCCNNEFCSCQDLCLWQLAISGGWLGSTTVRSLWWSLTCESEEGWVSIDPVMGLLCVQSVISPQIKCDQYWSDDGQQEFGDFLVALTDVADLSSYVIRTFKVWQVRHAFNGVIDIYWYWLCT